MERQRISSGTSWEAKVGYSRAVRAGSHIFVAGTTAVDNRGKVVGVNDPYAQASFVFDKIDKALNEAGASKTDVVRTRMYVIDIAYEAAVGRAHREHFGEIRPAATMLEIGKLVDPRLLVEIEVEAVVGDSD